MSGHPRYPARGSHFAHKAVRLMFKSCAAADIGLGGVALVTHIAHTEDARRYAGPVKFWNSQLANVMATSVDTIHRIRDRCVSAGWLHYERETNRSIGWYWVTVPPTLRDLDDNEIEPAGEVNEMIEQQNIHRTAAANHAVIEGANHRNSAANPAVNPAATSYPIPIPKDKDCPKTDEAVGGQSKLPLEVDPPPAKPAKKSSSGKKSKADPPVYSPEFREWWESFPRKDAKGEAAEPFQNALARLVADEDHPELTTESEALAFLVQRAGAYADLVKNEGTERRYIKTPAAWLNQSRYDDESLAPPPQMSEVEALEAAGWRVINPEAFSQGQNHERAAT